MRNVYRVDWTSTANGWAALVWAPGRPDLSRRFAPPAPWQKGKDARPVRVRADEYAAQLERDGYTYQPDYDGDPNTLTSADGVLMLPRHWSGNDLRII